ncbi:MAG: hypothetical protein OXC12_17100 [Spirochaetaceae bacterium]|nr:hypothetical protein [Spirochaetaceae bacterium]
MSRLFDLDAVVAGARHLCDRLLRGSEPYGCFRRRNGMPVHTGDTRAYLIDAIGVPHGVLYECHVLHTPRDS